MTPNQFTRTHKVTRWTRTPLRDGSMCYCVTPTDESGDRIVRFLSAHSWANDPHDDKANQDRDRVVLISGEPLPAWAIEWLDKANAKSCANARSAFRAAVDDADRNQDARNGW